MKTHLVLACVGLGCLTNTAVGDLPLYVQDSDVAVAHNWASIHLSTDVAKLPFSFKVGRESSMDVLSRSKSYESIEKIDDNRTRRTLIWVDERTGLETKAIAVEYADFPSVEWTIHFTNNGDQDSPILSAIEAIDLHQQVPAEASTVLHHMKGSRAAPNDFEPYEMGLTMRTRASFRSAGGRGSNGNWPYFNLCSEKLGLIVAVGWPGQWNLEFERDGAGTIRISGGQELTHFKLRPGESARTPLIVLQWYEGNWLRGQNIFRRWMVAHNLPRTDGKIPNTQFVACSSHQFGEMIHANEENQMEFIDRYLEEGFPLAYWWMDAGWYKNDGAWTTTGTWEVDKGRFPRGLRAITDHGRRRGVRSIVWFEPERVAPNSWLYNERPAWLLKPLKNPGDQLFDDKWRLLDLGNDEARKWLIEHVNGLIDSEGIDLYRQDFNMDPLLYWQAGEPEDRQGITENRYVSGYLGYWDALLEAHPSLRIDTCASGGRRLDLETLRRSVPLLRSDHIFEPASQQAHTYGISLWLPYHGTGTHVGKSAIGLHASEGISEYDFRSQMAPSVTACWDMRDRSLDYDKLRRLVGELSKISPFYLTDYYPLTRHSLAPNEWIAWQFNRPETGEAIVQAFRREACMQAVQSLKLHGLEAEAEYRISALGADESWSVSGSALMDMGLEVKLPTQRSAGLYFLKKADRQGSPTEQDDAESAAGARFNRLRR